MRPRHWASVLYRVPLGQATHSSKAFYPAPADTSDSAFVYAGPVHGCSRSLLGAPGSSIIPRHPELPAAALNSRFRSLPGWKTRN
eukprot:9468987-Heterocapsa_arctica.AAC.1